MVTTGSSIHRCITGCVGATQKYESESVKFPPRAKYADNKRGEDSNDVIWRGYALSRGFSKNSTSPILGGKTCY
eukprot:6203351-Pleurochrysis_carterae.AAC.5